MNKKLISVNMAIILIITLFANIVFAVSEKDDTAVQGEDLAMWAGDIIKFLPIGYDCYIQVSQNEIVPAPQIHDNYIFVGWKVVNNPENSLHSNKTVKWYMPGEVMDISGETTLQAAYIEDSRSAVAITLNGNGGITSDKSRYYITYASTPRLSLYKIPADKFTREGYTFNGFNTKTDGTGKTYDNEEVLTDDGKTYIYNLYAQWTENGTPSNPPSDDDGGGGGGGGAPEPSEEIIKNDDGSITTIKTDKKTGTVTETTKYLDGSTKEIVTQKDGTQFVTTNKKSGVKMEATISVNGKTTAKISIPKGIKSEDIVIPAQTLTSGTIAVLIKESGEEEIITNSIATQEGVLATFTENATVKIIDNSKEFSDVENHWANDFVDFVTARGLFNGTSERVFSPDITMTRGMLAVVLHNYEKNPEYSYDGKFMDVETDSWYGEAIGWLSDKGIATGYENGNFGAEDSITREQLAVFLYRYAGLPEHSGTISFADSDKISNYAIDAISWATEKGILSGKGNNMLDPQGLATRAEVATMITRFIRNIR